MPTRCVREGGEEWHACSALSSSPHPWLTAPRDAHARAPLDAPDILAHFLGTVILTQFVAGAWGYASIWAVFAFCK